jgi:polyhydroxybutyrate depolymerase
MIRFLRQGRCVSPRTVAPLGDARSHDLTTKPPRIRCPASVRLLVASLCMLAITSSCKGSDPEPKTSSETNFLRHCENQCDEGLSCLCGVCTKACTGASECSQFGGGAQCVSVPAHPNAPTVDSCQRGATCDMPCVTGTDCRVLGSGYLCEAGVCRTGGVVCPAVALQPGDQDRGVIVNDATRTYTVHVPTGYSGNTPVPLVLDFHPMSLGSAWEEANSGYKALSDQQGFIVVWPHGLETSWNVGPCCTTSSTIDDFAFARTIVRLLSIEACIDPRRVYAAGFSMGGLMAYYLACKQAEVFAAIAVSSSDLIVDADLACQPTRPVTEISFRGSADTVVPYAGGPSNPPGHADMALDLMGAVGTFEKWASLDHCTGSPSPEDANGCSTYSTCQDGTEVRLCTTQGGGQVVGDAALAWDLLKRHEMP